MPIKKFQKNQETSLQDHLRKYRKIMLVNTNAPLRKEARTFSSKFSFVPIIDSTSSLTIDSTKGSARSE